MSNEYFDPRTDALDHDILEGQVYGDTRHDPEGDGTEDEWPDHALYTLVYVDEHVVVMKTNNWTNRTDRRKYRQEARSVFEKEAGSGRYKLLEDVDNAPQMPDEFTEIRAMAMRLHDHYDQQGGRVNNHKVEALAEFVEELESVEPREIDVESISGVGPGTAQNLADEGLTTDVAITNAGKERLTDVGGVGDAVADRLLDKAT